MNVLIADKFEKVGIEGLERLGLEIFYEPDLKDDTLNARIKEIGANVLVVRSTKVTGPMMQDSQLGLIIRAGAGYNTIDVAEASNLGIFVSNCPGKNSHAVAELAFGLIVACDRRIADNVRDLRDGKWNKKEYSKAKGLNGRTLGLVGMGQIGQCMVPIAKAFGMRVIAFSRWMTADVAAALGIGRAESLEELAAQCDVISVHVALTPETRGMLNEAFFNRLAPGSIFINTSRSEVVNEADLRKATASGHIRAGLDVFEGEPTVAEGACETDICNVEGIYATHHIGASTEEAQNAVAHEVVRIVKEYKSNGHAPNAVNVPSGDKATHLLIVRHADRVGVLASLLTVLKDEGVNVQEMENIVLGPSHAAIAQIAVAKEPSPSAIHAIRTQPNVFDARVLPIERN